MQLDLLLTGAGIEEGPLGRRQLDRSAASIESDRETRPAVEVGSVAAASFPVRGRPAQVVQPLAYDAVVGQPALQAWPLAQQRLVGEAHRVVVNGDEAPAHQAVEHP